jgi:two-component system sensor histidine kinase KdpD
LRAALERAGPLEFDARERAYGGYTLDRDRRGAEIILVPLRLGTSAIGLLVASQSSLELGTLDAIAGLAAIAVERIQFLAERKAADLIRQRADLASTLLASLSHDLRTPLTAVSVAVANLQDDTLPIGPRREQARLAAQELDRLTRLFRNILDMARIDAAALTLDRDWVTAADVIDASVANLRPMLDDRVLDIDADGSTAVTVDPRLTSAALSHLIENAAQYSDGPVVIRGWVDQAGLHLTVRDYGPGLDPQELDQVFERFYRGRRMASQLGGTGMGLAIARGLLAAEAGRVWSENAAGGGAQFSIVVPGLSRAVNTEG